MKTVGSLFAGVGGFDLAFERAGFTTSWVVENDKQCQAVLRHRFPDAEVFGDVREVGRSNLSPVDIITGGVPCQDFSVAGRRAGLAGERSGLFWEFHRVVDELRPRWFLFENVPGLLSSNGGRDLSAILGGMAQLGYGWVYRVLDSQWFGVAQRRRRVFIVGHSGGVPRPEILALAEGMYGHPAPSRGAGEGPAPLLEVGARTSGDGHRDGDGIGHPGDPMYSLQASHQHGIAPTLSASGQGTARAGESRGQDPIVCQEVATPFTFQQNSRSEVRIIGGHGDIVGAIAAHHGAQQQNYIASDAIPRRLTPTECERLQGFPDGWTQVEYRGKPMADNPRYRMMGNAITVPVVEWIAKNLRDKGDTTDAR